MAIPLEIVGELPLSVERYLEVYFDRRFIAYLRRHLGVREYQVELLEMTASQCARTVKVALNLELPWAVRRALGSKGVSYLETALHHRGTGLIEWGILTNILPDKISVTGTTALEDLPGSRCRRTVSGEVAVGFRAIGPAIEASIAETILQGQRRGAELMVEYDRQVRATAGGPSL